MSRRPERLLAMAVLVCALGALVIAGDIDPPAGPVGPTMKDLVDVEPRQAIRNDFDTLTPIVISSSGSYYVAENILALPNQHGIEITADNVTLDLNGFKVEGNTEVGSLNGIHLPPGTRKVTIRNGTVQFFSGAGIHAQVSEELTVESVTAIGNGDDGIFAGERTIVRACRASHNTNYGFLLGSHSVVTDSIASDNTVWSGFNGGIGTTYRNCTASANGADGFLAGSYSTIESCTADSNASDGFDMENGSSISNSTARSNGVDGIRASGPGSVHNCTTRLNGDDGIHVTFSCTVSRCSSNDNTSDGIHVGGDGNYILDNTCHSNDGAGVFVLELRSRNRIDGNNCTSNAFGIEVNGTDNIVVRNSVSGNTVGQYNIAADNRFGIPTDVSGTDIFASDQPWANFVY